VEARRWVVAIAIVGIAAGAVGWWRGRGPDAGHHVAAVASPQRTRVHADPRGLDRASIAGAIRDAVRLPIAGARVCAELAASDVLSDAPRREPWCTTSDLLGRYQIDGLAAGDYQVTAMARGHAPAGFVPDGDRRLDGALRPGGGRAGSARPWLVLGAGEHRTGIDLVLGAGGVEITGTVTDVSGGPIGHAVVRADGAVGPSAETDAAGGYTLWLARGHASITASADGYSDDSDVIDAPGRLDFQLTPESLITGTVIDASTGAPLAGVRVESAGGETGASDVTDAAGQFQLAGLVPGRYAVIARSATRYGRSAGSLLVGLAQPVGPIVVPVYPAFQVSGHVVLQGEGHAICPDAAVGLARGAVTLRSARAPGGELHVDGVVPGRYEVTVNCSGTRTHYNDPPVVVIDGDVTHVEWHAGPATRSAERAPEAVASGSGEIRGQVVDGDGAPVGGVHVVALVGGIAGSNEAMIRMGVARIHQVRTHDDGSFALADLVPGDYDLVAGHASWAGGILRTPDGTDEARARATVVAGAVATVKLVVEPMTGTITGTVEGPDGAPAGDAFVTATREAAGGDVESAQAGATSDRPVVTGPDGRFQLTRLSPGSYTISAERASGGHGQVEHVAAGGVATLRIRPTASISGTVHRDGGAPARLDLEVHCGDESRNEQFFRTGGGYAIGDLPAGECTLTYQVDGGITEQVVTLAEGEHKAGVDVELSSQVTLTGRVIDFVTHAPVPGIRMRVTPRGADDDGDDGDQVTGADGRFTIHHAPQGAITLSGWPEDFEGGRGYEQLDLPRTIAMANSGAGPGVGSGAGPGSGSGTGVIDLGDLVDVRDRVRDGDPVGTLGFTWAEKYSAWRVGAIDPAGPAARSGLQPGDVVTSIDGAGVTGDAAEHGMGLLEAPPGTVLRLGLARGPTIALTLGAPRDR
jgi:hypothetical protein